LPKRLECWLFSHSFSRSTIHDDIETVIQAAKELELSTKWQQVLALVLTLANFMNGTRNRQYGFKLNSLLKLNDTKSTDGSGTTLLHYLVSWIERDHAHLLDFDSELLNLAAASKVVMSSIREEMRKTKQGIEEIGNQLKSIDEYVHECQIQEQKRIRFEIQLVITDIMEGIVKQYTEESVDTVAQNDDNQEKHETPSNDDDHQVVIPDTNQERHETPSNDDTKKTENLTIDFTPPLTDRMEFDRKFATKMRSFYEQAVKEMKNIDDDMEEMLQLLSQISQLYNESENELSAEPDKFFSVIDQFLNMFRTALTAIREKRKQEEEKSIRRSRSAANLARKSEQTLEVPPQPQKKTEKPVLDSKRLIQDLTIRIEVSSPQDESEQTMSDKEQTDSLLTIPDGNNKIMKRSKSFDHLITRMENW
jgi:DNA-binding protein H-NS